MCEGYAADQHSFHAAVLGHEVTVLLVRKILKIKHLLHIVNEHGYGELLKLHGESMFIKVDKIHFDYN